MSTSTLTPTRLATLPRVDLLPPEIRQRRRGKQLQGAVVAGVVACAAAVGVGYLLAAGDANKAEDDLAAAKQQGVVLQAETAKYQDAPRLAARVEAAEAQRAVALGAEIRWSFYLNDFALRLPPKTWFTKVTVTPAVAAVAPAGGAAPSGTTTVPGALATIQFDGKGYVHNDVAAFLEMTAREKGFAGSYLTTSQVDQTLRAPGGKPAISFTTTASVTAGALSNRYTQQKAGS